MSHIDCGEGIKKRYRTCQSASSGINCDGFPMQVMPCYIPCDEASNEQEVQPSQNGYEWSDWSDWVIECDNQDSCLKIRRRSCINNKLLRRSVRGFSNSLIIDKLDNCIGNDIETTNCSKSYCENQRRDNFEKTRLKPSLWGIYFKNFI